MSRVAVVKIYTVLTCFVVGFVDVDQRVAVRRM